jgi:hypothetical protein
METSSTVKMYSQVSGRVPKSIATRESRSYEQMNEMK